MVGLIGVNWRGCWYLFNVGLWVFPWIDFIEELLGEFPMERLFRDGSVVVWFIVGIGIGVAYKDFWDSYWLVYSWEFNEFALVWFKTGLKDKNCGKFGMIGGGMGGAALILKVVSECECWWGLLLWIDDVIGSTGIVGGSDNVGLADCGFGVILFA